MTRLFRITARRTGCGALIIINYVSRYYGWLARRGSRTASLIRSSRLDSMWHNRSSDVAQRQSPDQFHRCPHATAASESGIVWVGPADDDDDDCGAGVGASHGHPWQLDLNFPFQIFQSKDRLDILFEEYHGFVRVAMDPAKAAAPGYMGRSIGRWDGDTGDRDHRLPERFLARRQRYAGIQDVRPMPH